MAYVLQSLSTGAAGGSTQPRVAVVAELFTSEGCSSCPPADQAFIRLAEVVAISDYTSPYRTETTLPVHPGWNRRHLRVVAFVQAIGSRAIVGAAATDLRRNG